MIPARLQSTRLPKKLLLEETGKPLIQHTVEAARRSKLADAVVVATDAQVIFDAVKSFGGQVIMTDETHPSGTDRVAEYAITHAEFELLINVQGDEPEIAPEIIDQLILRLRNDSAISMVTAACPLADPALARDPACVKVVVDSSNCAIYFSRNNIPFCRDEPDAVTSSHFQHLGIYGYRREFLLRLASMPSGKLESIEKLEQLRAIEAGYRIGVEFTSHAAKGIDTAADYAAFVRRQKT